MRYNCSPQRWCSVNKMNFTILLRFWVISKSFSKRNIEKLLWYSLGIHRDMYCILSHILMRIVIVRLLSIHTPASFKVTECVQPHHELCVLIGSFCVSSHPLSAALMRCHHLCVMMGVWHLSFTFDPSHGSSRHSSVKEPFSGLTAPPQIKPHNTEYQALGLVFRIFSMTQAWIWTP